jgi:hypothetical protein
VNTIIHLPPLPVKRTDLEPEPEPTPVARVPYYELQFQDSKHADRLAEAIATIDLNQVKTQGPFFVDFAAWKDRQQSAWYRALGAYVLRYCRRSWRKYAYARAVDRACEMADLYMAQYFCELPTLEQPLARIPIDPAKRRALLSLLVNEALNTYRSVLDGAAYVEPGVYEQLHAQEQVQR